LPFYEVRSSTPASSEPEVFFEIFDQTLDEARLAVLVDAVLQVFSDNFNLNLARLFLDDLVRGLALDDARCRSSRCTHLSRVLGFHDLGERSVGPHRAHGVVRARAQEILELLALRASRRVALFEKTRNSSWKYSGSICARMRAHLSQSSSVFSSLPPATQFSICAFAKKGRKTVSGRRRGVRLESSRPQIGCLFVIDQILESMKNISIMSCLYDVFGSHQARWRSPAFDIYPALPWRYIVSSTRDRIFSVTSSARLDGVELST
jgi:hypothetical protein